MASAIEEAYRAAGGKPGEARVRAIALDVLRASGGLVTWTVARTFAEKCLGSDAYLEITRLTDTQTFLRGWLAYLQQVAAIHRFAAPKRDQTAPLARTEPQDKPFAAPGMGVPVAPNRPPVLARPAPATLMMQAPEPERFKMKRDEEEARITKARELARNEKANAEFNATWDERFNTFRLAVPDAPEEGLLLKDLPKKSVDWLDGLIADCVEEERRFGRLRDGWGREAAYLQRLRARVPEGVDGSVAMEQAGITLDHLAAELAPIIERMPPGIADFATALRVGGR